MPDQADDWCELLELVELAKCGQVSIRTTTFTIDDALDAYRPLHACKIIGRAVIVPG